MRTCLLLAIGLAATGCNRGTAQDAVLPPDAAIKPDGAAPAAKPDAGIDLRPISNEPPSTLTGTQVLRYLNDQGPEEVIPNLTDAKVSAWSLSPDDTYKFVPGRGGADGKVMVPDVPGGPFLMRFWNNYFAADTMRGFDLDGFYGGRPVRARPSRPMTLTLDFSGLNPWQSGDRLVFYAPSVLSTDFGLQSKVVPTVVAGATSVMGVADYFTFGDPYLLDGPGHGDEVWLMQQSTLTSPQGQRYLVTKKVASTKALKLVDGQPATLTAAFTDVAQDKTFSVDWAVPEYAALSKSVNPAATKMTGTLFLWAAPAHDRWGDVSWGAHTFLMGVGMDTPAVKFTASYGDPFPAAWGRLGGAYVFYQVPISVPGASTPGELTAVVHFNDTVAKFNGPIRPTLTPPGDPKIDGRSAFAEVLGTGATPLVSWSPPEVGTPEVYKLYLYRARVSEGRVLFDYLAVFFTEATSLRLPPDLLQFGESYVLKLEALIEDGVSVNKPFHRAVHRAFSQTVTARFTP
jgi:hypothetical protein